MEQLDSPSITGFGATLSMRREPEISSDSKGGQISLKDTGLFTFAKLVFTATTPFVGGLSLSSEDTDVTVLEVFKDMN